MLKFPFNSHDGIYNIKEVIKVRALLMLFITTIPLIYDLKFENMDRFDSLEVKFNA